MLSFVICWPVAFFIASTPWIVPSASWYVCSHCVKKLSAVLLDADEPQWNELTSGGWPKKTQTRKKMGVALSLFWIRDVFCIQHLTVFGALRKHISNRDCWRHFEKPKPRGVIMNVIAWPSSWLVAFKK